MIRVRFIFVALLVAAVALAAAPPYLHKDQAREITGYIVAVDDSSLATDTFLVNVGGFTSVRYWFEIIEDDDSLPGQGLDDSIHVAMDILKNQLWVETDTGYGTVVTDTITDLIPTAESDSLGKWIRFRVYIRDTVTAGAIEYAWRLIISAK